MTKSELLDYIEDLKTELGDMEEQLAQAISRTKEAEKELDEQWDASDIEAAHNLSNLFEWFNNGRWNGVPMDLFSVKMEVGA